MTEVDGRRFYALRGVRDNVYVNDVPRSPVTRAAKLAGLPIGLAGRTALGVGKRIGGRPAEIVAEEIQRRTADQIFRVLGELKGGAMKLGQALSIFEAALPPEIAGPYRATLTRLQESAPPLPARTVHQVLARELGASWRDRFVSFSDVPAAAASIGQVHQAVWEDGQRVAVKIQYPGAGRALISDFNQLSRAGRLFGLLMPGLEVKPLLDELRDRVAEELDYGLEAASQRAFASAYLGDPDIYIPDVVLATDQVLVTEWMDGTPLSRIISDGSQEQRDRAGILLTRFLFSGPGRAGLLHADPHPGNFRLLDDGRLGVLDFGAVDHLPDGLPPFFGRLLRIMHSDSDAADPSAISAVERELRENGFLRPGVHVDLDALYTFLAPLAEPSGVDSFKFNREWLRGEAARVTDMRSSNIARQLNLPPSYVLIHRMSTAGIGVLCQLECEGNFRAEVLPWMPGYFDADPAVAG
jgi:predicted unusual protein kinase regulating ubiquinone biosynthesis (AarF/ABC1/UbiB family)